MANIIRLDGELFDKESNLKETWVSGRRFEFESDATQDLAGVWKIRLDKVDLLELELRIGGSEDKPTAHNLIARLKNIGVSLVTVSAVQLRLNCL